MAYIISPRSSKSFGPGVKLLIAKAPSRMAAAGVPGTPRVMVGSNAPPTVALLAVSGANTPMGAPLPNSSGLSERRFSSA